jgi:hypothetical protein
MRVEGHGHGHATALDSAPLYTVEDLQVSAVEAVEIAQCQHRAHEP